MSERIHALAQSMFGKASLEECNVQEIENITKKYPYFSPAQFLYLQKLKQENSEAYPQQMQRSLLHYHDPLQFDYFINSDKFYLDLSQFTTEVDDSEDESFVQADLEEEADNASIQTDLPEKENIPVNSVPAEVVQENDATATHELQEQQKAEDSAASEEIKKTLQVNHVSAKNDLVFEPYHTVDYFASQGIKASLEAPKDKFGKQLKSFTDWLKEMKKLPAADLPKNVEVSGEKTVVNLATHSVDETQVLTEAMAEVWAKQGNTEKAIEIYNKLSLLNPSKTAFFAAKIDNLKRS